MRIVTSAPPWAEKHVSDLTDMHRDPLPVAPGTEVEIEAPDDAYVEYGFVDASGRVRPDPAGETTTKSPWYGEISCATGARYERPRLADPPEGTPEGTTDRLRLQSGAMDGDTRRVAVYTPVATAEDDATPLVLVQDGVAFMRIAAVHRVIQALIDGGEIDPVRVAFVEPADRDSEYAFSPKFSSFVEDELEPELASRYPLTDRRVYLGASLGGLASATLALRRAKVTGDGGAVAVASLSGAFLGTPDDPDPYRSRRSRLLDLLRSGSGPMPGRWAVHTGTLEWLTAVNRDVADALGSKGDVSVDYTESSAGHNWRNWQDAAPNVLRSVLARVRA